MNQILAVGTLFFLFALRVIAAYIWPSAESKVLPLGKASKHLAFTKEARY